MADAMVKEGETKAAAIDQIAASVEEKSKAVRAEMAKEEQAVLAKLEQVKKDLANEQHARLNAARASTTTYIGQLKDLYTAQIKYIGSLSGLNADGSKPAAPVKDPVVTVPPEQQEKVAQDIEASMAKIFDTPAEQPRRCPKE